MKHYALRQLDELLCIHMKPTHNGKVRDSYVSRDTSMRLVVVSDRISIYDFVMGFSIPYKGEVLTALSILMRLKLFEMRPEYAQDLAFYGTDIDKYLPNALCYIPTLQKRATVVHVLEMILVEAIVRGYLTGSGWSDYKKTGVVCGHELPHDLVEGSKLERPLFTPTTKAQDGGHDEPLDYAQVVKTHGTLLEDRAIDIYNVLAKVAAALGFIFVDTKLEFGWLGTTFVLGDEVATGDSSRYWDMKEYGLLFPTKLPSPYDKQIVRDWGKKFGLDDKTRWNPKNPEHQKAAKDLVPSRKLVTDTTDRYMELFERIAKMKLAQFQKDVMNIK